MRNSRRWKVAVSLISAVSMLLAVPMTASAMPGDVRGDGLYNNSGSAGGDGLYGTPDGLYSNGNNQSTGAHAQDSWNENDYLQPIEKEYVATGAANLRAYPNGPIIGVLVPGQKYHVYSRRLDVDWYKVKGPVQNGYVYAQYLMDPAEDLSNRPGGAAPAPKEEDVEKLDLMMKATTNVNVRRTPNGEVVGKLKEGQDIHVIGNVNHKTWYKCKYKGEEAYVYDDYLVPDFPQFMEATHNVNVRTKPSSNAPIQGSLAIGDCVKVKEMEDGWYKFKFPATGETGYSDMRYLAAIAG